MIVTGGAGIGGNINVGGSLSVNNNLLVGGSNVTLGDVSAVHISGGITGYVLSTNGAGTLTWTSVGALPGGFNGGTITNALTISSSVVSTSTTTGALIVTGGAGIGGNLYVGGGTINFATLGARITGDYSNGTIANRVAVQTSTADGITNFGLLPNGSSATSALNAYNSSDPTNAAYLNLGITATTAIIAASTRGSGTYVPMSFQTSGIERLSIDTNGNVTATGNLIVNSNATVAGVTTLGSISNVRITGGSANYVIQTDGAGNLSWVAVSALQQQFNGGSIGNILIVSNTNVSVSTTSGAIQTTGGMGVAGNINIGGNFINVATSGARITGNFSDLVYANRLSFQTQQSNNYTHLQALPSGSGSETVLNLFNNSNPTNAAMLSLLSNATEARISAATTGTGISLPMNFYTGGARRIQIDTIGNVAVTGNITVGSNLTVASRSSFGPVGNVIITGGTNGYVLTTDGSGNLSWNSIGSLPGTFNGGTITNALAISNSTLSTSTTTGALTVTGGVGIGGNLYANGQTNYIGGNLRINGSNASSSTATGALTVTGGVGIGGNLFVGGGNITLGSISNVHITGGISGYVVSTDGAGNLTWSSVSSLNPFNGGTIGNILIQSNATAATSTTTGAIQVVGGVGIQGNLYVGGSKVSLGAVAGVSITGGISGYVLSTDGSGNLTWSAVSGLPGGFNGGTITNALAISNSTVSTSTTTGALTVTGGVGIGGALYVGSGANLGAVTGLVITGGSSNQVLTTNGSGVLTWATVASLQQQFNGGTIGNILIQSNATVSTSTTTGAIQVAGGVGIQGALFVGGGASLGAVTGVKITGGTNGYVLTTDGSANLTWSSVSSLSSFNGGTIGNILIQSNTTTATSTTTGAIQVAGGVGIQGNLYVGGSKVSLGAATGIVITGGNSGYVLTTDGSGNLSWGAGNSLVSTFNGGTITNALIITNSIASTSSVTGALRVTGGVGIGGNLYVGGSVAYLGSATGVVITGGISGYVLTTDGAGNLSWGAGNAFVSTFNGGTITNALIITNSTAATSTSTGALRVTGGVGIQGAIYAGGDFVYQGSNISLGDVSVVSIGGGAAGYILGTDGTGTLSWVAGSSVAGQWTTNTTAGGSGLDIFYPPLTQISGNVGIGTSITTSVGGSNNLSVGGNVYVRRQHFGNASDTVTSPSYSWLGSPTTGFYKVATTTIGVTANGIDALRIGPGTGNTAVGATNQIAARGDFYASGAIQPSNSSGSADGVHGIIWASNPAGASGSAWIKWYNGGFSSLYTTLEIGTGSDTHDVLLFNTAGNVGFNVTNPSYKVDISGDVNITGTYRVNGTAIGTGSGTVSSIGMTVPSFLSVTPATITTSGTFAVSLSGAALPATSGGTGRTSAFTTNAVFYGANAATMTQTAAAAANQILISDASGIPTWSSAIPSAAGVSSISFAGTGLTPATATAGAVTVAGTLDVNNGGTGLATVPTNGQILIGNGTSYTLASVTGTANQVTVAPGVGSITLSLPQSIATTSTPTFASMTLNNATGPQLSLTGGTSNYILMPASGAAAPTFSTRSAGTKVVLFNSLAVAAADYAIGYTTSTLWNSVATTAASFAWYGGTTQVATLSGVGSLSVTGEVTAYSSDARLKTNVAVITSALDKVNSLRGVTFDWDQEKAGELDFFPRKDKDVGVIAQDVQAVLPEAVRNAPFDWNTETNSSRSGDNYLTVQYEKLTALLIEAVKELKTEVDTLKVQIADLQNKA